MEVFPHETSTLCACRDIALLHTMQLNGNRQQYRHSFWCCICAGHQPTTSASTHCRCTRPCLLRYPDIVAELSTRRAVNGRRCMSVGPSKFDLQALVMLRGLLHLLWLCQCEVSFHCTPLRCYCLAVVIQTRPRRCAVCLECIMLHRWSCCPVVGCSDVHFG